MKNKILIIIATLFLVTGCNGVNQDVNGKTPSTTPNVEATGTIEPIEEEATENIEDYFPIIDSAVYEYTSEESEELNHKIFNTSTKENKLHQTIFSGNLVTDQVYEITNDKVEMYYTGTNNFFLDSKINESKDESVSTIIQWPLKIGNKWEDVNGDIYEITDIGMDISVPFGEYKAIEITSSSSLEVEGVEKIQTISKYYAKEIGLIKTIITIDDHSSEVVLENFSTDIGKKIALDIYTADDQINFLEHSQMEISIKSNEDMKEILAKALKKEKSKYLSDNVVINKLEYIEEDNVVLIDLSEEYIFEMNAGTGYESLLLQGLTNTLCDYTNAVGIIINIDGMGYESGHFAYEKDYVMTSNKQ